MLNLGAIEQTVATSRDFSDLNLVHIQSKSALGVHLKYGPFIQQQAQQAAMPPEDYLNMILQKYAELAGLETVPEHLEPIFIEYEGGVPEVEYGTRGERWLDSNMDTSILPSALGQALRREVLWIRDVLSDRHDERNRLSGTGQYPGRNAEEGFLGLLVAQEVANKILFLYETMQAEAETTPSGYYFPHEFKVDFDGEKPQAYIVEDGSSYLFDQVSLLWGLSEFERVADPKGGALYSNIFGQGQLISGDFHRMAKELVQILLQNLETLHWNSKYDSLYELNALDQQEHTPATEDEAKGEMISTHMAAMAIIALESVYHNFADTPAIQAKAKSLLLRQVEFLTRHLYREEDGAMYNGAALADEVKPFTGLKTLLAHAAAIRSYLIAYQITGDLNYLNIANRIFEFLDKTFWDARLQIYRSALGGSQYQYTPLNVAMTVGAFRELLQVNSSEYLERIHQHFSKFFEHIVERTGLQLSEQQYFLELLGQSRTLAPVFASDLTIQPVGSSVDAAIPQPGSSLFYTIQVTDEQLGCDIENAYIEDVLPEGVTFVRSDPLPESVDGRVIRWWVADLTPNDDGVYTLQIEVQINPFSMSGVRYDEIVSGLQTWHVNNCASLWCRTPGVGNSPMTTDCVDDEIKLPRLGVEKSLRSLEIEPGKDVEFEIGVMNLSEVTAYTITVEDQNPDGLIYLKNSERSPDVVGVELDDTQPLVWVLEDLEPGRSIRLTYKVHLDPQLEEGLYTTTVKVHAMDRSGFPFETNEFKLDVRVGREIFLNVTQDFLNEEDAKGVWAGKPFSVLNTLENVGSEGLTECTLLVTLPEDFSYIPESSLLNNVSIGKPIRDGQQLTWKLGELLLSDRKTLQYTLEVSDEIVGTYMLKTLIKGTTSAGDEFESPEQKFEVEILR